MSYICVDVESDGPCPGLYSMVSLGAVVVEPGLNRAFFGKFAPLPDAKWIPEALAVSNVSREEHLAYPDPIVAMMEFEDWVTKNGGPRPMFISDNNGFDWQFVNYYFHNFCGRNPFGHSSTNLGSLYKGMEKSMFVNFKHLRDTKHTHNPVDDSRGNAEAFLKIQRRGLVVHK